MVRSRCTQIGRKLRARLVTELFGVYTELEAVLFRAREDGAAFVYRERMVIAEGVAVLGQTQHGDFGNEFFDDEADVLGAAIFVFGWDGVGGQQSRDDSSRAFSG